MRAVALILAVTFSKPVLADNTMIPTSAENDALISCVLDARLRGGAIEECSIQPFDQCLAESSYDISSVAKEMCSVHLDQMWSSVNIFYAEKFFELHDENADLVVESYLSLMEERYNSMRSRCFRFPNGWHFSIGACMLQSSIDDVKWTLSLIDEFEETQ